MRALSYLVAVVVAGCAAAPAGSSGDTPTRLRAEVVQVLPHDPTAFTQGLELVDGVLYEGTGREGSSAIKAVDPNSGAVRAQTALPADLFGEGITAVGPTIWQLTWRNGIAIRRDRATLAELRRVGYQGEGWGLCHDTTANRLVMSDGTDRLTFRDPETFDVLGDVRVSANGEPVTRLNELECVPGPDGGVTLYANIWQTDTVVNILPSTGRVRATIDLANLLPADERAGADVLNGIAAIPGTDEFLVTGKLWPKLFRVKFVPTAP